MLLKIKTYKEATQKIFQIEKTNDYTLSNMKKAIKLLGDPLKGKKIIHIAGTNGKGSVSKMVFSILKLAGYKVGVYTSPHLIDIRERFCDYKGNITKKEFVEILNEILKLPLDLSYFEKTTLISFLFFKKKKLEYCVVEVGLGGLLDCTNVVNPTITAITSIGMDHIDYLGNTIDEISFQKAGIIKEKIPIIINHKNKIIFEYAKNKNSEIIYTDKEYETNLLGNYQRKNAAIAYEIGKYLKIDESIILEGLKLVEHKGRLQYKSYNLLIDGAHNEDGLFELKKYIDLIKDNYKNIFYCFSLKKGKDISLIINVFGKDNNYIYIKSNHILVEDSNIIFNQSIKLGIDLKITKSKNIIDMSYKNKDDLFLVFGSLYMIGEFIK